MKNSFKKIIALFSAASLLFLGACTDTPKDITDVRNQTIEVAVDDFTAEFIFNDKGLIEKEKKYYDNLEVTYEYYECYEYNENGQITKRYATDLEGNVLEKHDFFEIFYKENSDIEMISENGINYVFEYDGKGNPVKYTKLKNSVALAVYSFEYDENGNKIKEIKENTENNAVDTTVYTYNESGLAVSEKTVSSNGNTINDIAYEYNADGLVSKRIRKADEETRTTVYEYKKGVLVKETMTLSDLSDDDGEREYVTTYEYYGNGNVVEFSRARDGEIYITDAYSADEAKGNFAKIADYVSL
ncbi:MAG: hypothetical protein IKK63_03875 [Clostridia bacterium]|nr:hypothetical protein [Clostridia bacterium]